MKLGCYFIFIYLLKAPTSFFNLKHVSKKNEGGKGLARKISTKQEYAQRLAFVRENNNSEKARSFPVEIKFLVGLMSTLGRHHTYSNLVRSKRRLLKTIILYYLLSTSCVIYTQILRLAPKK
jgi:hypothetical protein